MATTLMQQQQQQPQQQPDSTPPSAAAGDAAALSRLKLLREGRRVSAGALSCPLPDLVTAHPAEARAMAARNAAAAVAPRSTASAIARLRTSIRSGLGTLTAAFVQGTTASPRESTAQAFRPTRPPALPVRPAGSNADLQSTPGSSALTCTMAAGIRGQVQGVSSLRSTPVRRSMSPSDAGGGYRRPIGSPSVSPWRACAAAVRLRPSCAAVPPQFARGASPRVIAVPRAASNEGCTGSLGRGNLTDGVAHNANAEPSGANTGVACETLLRLLPLEDVQKDSWEL